VSPAIPNRLIKGLRGRPAFLPRWEIVSTQDKH
jgi:hypothetical protein